VRVAGTLTQVAASLAAASAAPTRTRGWSILKFWMPGGSPKAF
jgi:hypothetical protein